MKPNILEILRENEQQLSIWFWQTGQEKYERWAEKFFAVDTNNDKISINCFSQVKLFLESGSKWQL